MSGKEKKFLYYKGKPLVRCKNTIYYGDTAEKYIIKLQILSTKKMKDLEIADKVSVQLLSTDPDLSSRKKIVKTSEKEGLYRAMDLGSIWLERALSE